MKKIILSIAFVLSILTLKAQCGEITHHIVDFESPYEYLKVDTSSQNIWQIAEPGKTFFDSARSLSNAIITDSIQSYPVNNHSYFDVLMGSFNYGEHFPYSISLEFFYKIDSDSLRDGGYITFSVDNGETWANVMDEDGPPFDYCWGIQPKWSWGWLNIPMYTSDDTLYNGEYGLSGHSEDWKRSVLTWSFLPVKTDCPESGDTMIVRFNFLSDSIDTQKEGLKIDDIRLFTYCLSGVESYEQAAPLFLIQPNPVTDRSTIKIMESYKNIRLQLFRMDGQLVRQADYQYQNEIDLLRGDLASGVYLLRLNLDGREVTRKVVME